MRNQLDRVVAIVVVIGAVLVGAAAAESRQQLTLPPAHALPRTGDSPAAVVFNHESHVDATAPMCTACHPRLFKILAPGATTNGKAITHDAMNSGQSCGSCHNGRRAFGLDDCTVCHRDQ